MSIFSSDNSNFPQTVLFSSENSVQDNSNSSFVSAPIQLSCSVFDSVVMTYASFPKSFYNMPVGYNSFLLSETLSSVTTSVTINLTIGSVNKNNLILDLIAQLNAGSPHGWVYNVTYPGPSVPDTFKLTFTVTPAAGGISSFTMLSGYKSPYRQLGFESNTVYPLTSGTLTTPNVINLNYVSAIVIRTNMIKDNDGDVFATLLGIGSYPFGSVMYFEQINYDLNTHIYSGTTYPNFTATDEVGQPIDFNGASWLMLCKLFTRSDTHEIQRQDLYIQNAESLLRYNTQQQSLLQQPGLAPIFSQPATQGQPAVKDYKIHYPE